MKKQTKKIIKEKSVQFIPRNITKFLIENIIEHARI